MKQRRTHGPASSVVRTPTSGPQVVVPPTSISPPAQGGGTPTLDMAAELDGGASEDWSQEGQGGQQQGVDLLDETVDNDVVEEVVVAPGPAVDLAPSIEASAPSTPSVAPSAPSVAVPAPSVAPSAPSVAVPAVPAPSVAPSAPAVAPSAPSVAVPAVPAPSVAPSAPAVAPSAPSVAAPIPAEAKIAPEALEADVKKTIAEKKPPGDANPADPEQAVEAGPPASDAHSAMERVQDEDDVEQEAYDEQCGVSDEAKTWILDAGDVTSIMPPKVAKAYRRALSAAKKGELTFPGKGTEDTQKPYRRFIRVYKAWMTEEFGQSERRVNRELVNKGGDKAKANGRGMAKYISGNLAQVAEGHRTGGQELFKQAAESFAIMAADADKDGVHLEVRSAYRKPGNAKPKNRSARAANSSHSYGLAIDLTLSVKEDKFRVKEIRTGDAKNLMKYFGSPVTKWMIANGARYNWHPYTNEPWHFEYNPPGLVESIIQAAKG